MCLTVKQSSHVELMGITKYEIENPDVNILAQSSHKDMDEDVGGWWWGCSMSSFPDKRTCLGALAGGIMLLELSVVLKQLQPHRQTEDTDRRTLEDTQADSLTDGRAGTRQRNRRGRRFEGEGLKKSKHVEGAASH